MRPFLLEPLRGGVDTVTATVVLSLRDPSGPLTSGDTVPVFAVDTAQVLVRFVESGEPIPEFGVELTLRDVQ